MPDRGNHPLRMSEHPVLGKASARNAVSFTFNGRELMGYEGESIATALWANGIRLFRRDLENFPRGLYCGSGQCYECRVTVNGVPNVRSCLAPLLEGMRITADDLRLTGLQGEVKSP